MADDITERMQADLDARYADAPSVGDDMHALAGFFGRGSCRHFRAQDVPKETVDVLCAAALAAPTKSDLQGRDIVVLWSPEKRVALAEMVGEQDWVKRAPLILIFCGNNRRQRLIHGWHDIAFANDHLDAFFNAAADAAIALGAFVAAAEAIGLGCCPISAVRNEAQAVSDLIGLPQHVFPFAGLALGYPTYTPRISPRLPLGVTCHVDTYQERDLRTAVERYDRERGAVRPYAQQRFQETFGPSQNYGWSEDKARQYSAPERADFGSYVRARGFSLD